MVLIIGGAFQNKREYAIEKYAIAKKAIEVYDIECDSISKSEVSHSDIKFNDTLSVKIIDNVQAIVKNKLLKNEYSVDIFDELIAKNSDIIFICDEVGSGIVPINKFDRNYRDKVGEICCHLAEKAKTVHRVVCGLGIMLKDDSEIERLIELSK